MSCSKVILIDFRFAEKFPTKDFPDPKKAHNGKFEYLSRDSHEGILTPRGNIESLGYNLFIWIGNQFPW